MRGNVAGIMGFGVGHEEVCCVLCGSAEETSHHLLIECLVSRIIWSSFPWALDICIFSNQPLSSWLQSIIDPFLIPGLPSDAFLHFQLYALNTWDLLWWSRNQIVHNEAVLDILSLVARKSKVSEDHLAAWARRGEITEIACWSPPSLGQIKVNFDVALRAGFFVGAAVLHDHQGRVVGAKVQQSSVVGPLEGEVFATSLGLEVAQALGFQDVIMEGYSLLAVEALSTSIPCEWTGRFLVGLRRFSLLALPFVLAC